MIYYLIFGLFIVFGLIEVNLNVNKRLKIDIAILFTTSIFTLILVAGFRQVGFDYGSYRLLFENINLSNYLENAIELSFAILASIFQYYEIPFAFFTLTYAVPSICLKANFFYRYSPYIFTSLIVYFSTTYLFSDMGQMRNGLAFGIILWAFPNAFKKQKFVFFTKVILAIFIHSSAIIILPAYFIMHSKRIHNKNMITAIILLIPLTFFDIRNLLFWVSEKLPISQLEAKVAFYAFSEEFGLPLGLNVSLLLRIVILLVMINCYTIGKRKFESYQELIRLYFFGICLYILFNSIAEFAIRFSNYFKILECVILPMLISFGKTRLEKNVIFSLILLYTMYSIYKVLMDPLFSPMFIPYKNYLLDV